MTTPDHQAPAPDPSAPEYQDRIYRSPAGIAAGVLLLAVVLWLGIDALVVGHGRTPWLALAGMILVIPLIVAFTLRPAVYASEERLRIRNPFRVIVLPWGSLSALRSGYSNEAVATGGTRYQLWALPVSLRARNKAARQQSRSQGQDGRSGAAGGSPTAAPAGPVRARTDQTMDELRELAQRHQKSEHAQGEPSVRWAYEVLGPAAAGAVLLVILVALG
ncbi:PH domain-containing protein [Streptomyces nodosus]